jgi:hypothetical protein
VTQALRLLITPLIEVFDQTFSQKVCGQAFPWKGGNQLILKNLF